MSSAGLTDGGEDLHGAHGGLDVEPELLQREQALAVQVLQLRHQDQVLLHQGPHGRRQRVVHLPVLKRRALLREAVRDAMAARWVNTVQAGE